MGVAWVAFGIVVILLCLAYQSARQKQKKQFEELKGRWGKEPSQDIDGFVWEQIRMYHQLCPESCRVDQTTWNDLNMDQVFMRLNATVSSAGEELLYHRLHQPEGTYLSSLEQEAWIARFQQDERFRHTIQHILFRLGKVRTSGVSAYLFRENTQVLRHEKGYLLMGMLPLVVFFCGRFLSAGFVVAGCAFWHKHCASLSSLLSFAGRSGEHTLYGRLGALCR